MSPFTSDRERNLWLWTLAVMVAIYSTLGPVRTLVEMLRERNLLRLTIAVILFLVVGTIAVRWIKSRPNLGEVGVALAVAAAYLWAWVRIPIPEERTHLIEYGLVAALIYLALNERRRHGGRVPVPAVLAVVVTARLGILDEMIQALLPNRYFDIHDIGFNALAGLMAIAAILALAKARRWRRKSNV